MFIWDRRVLVFFIQNITDKVTIFESTSLKRLEGSKYIYINISAFTASVRPFASVGVVTSLHVSTSEFHGYSLKWPGASACPEDIYISLAFMTHLSKN